MGKSKTSIKHNCDYCNTGFESYYAYSKYCSIKCCQKIGNLNRREKECSELIHFCKGKASNYTASAEYLAELGNKRECVYCGMKNLSLKSNVKLNPNLLSFDCIFRKKNESRKDAHREGNLNPCCFFCNRMRCDTPYELWIQLLNFLKGKENLDVSNDPFMKINSSASECVKISTIWETLKKHEEDKGNHITMNEAKNLFCNLMKKQKSVDNIYNIFSLMRFNVRSHPLNVSVDQDDMNGYQLIPLFINLAKNTLTTSELKIEFNKRGFLQPGCQKKIVYPSSYKKDSFFEYFYKLQLTPGEKTGLSKGLKGYKRTPEQKKKISESLKKMYNSPSFEKKPYCFNPKICKRIQMMTNEENPSVLKTFDSVTLAAEFLNISSANISRCATSKPGYKSCHGYKWKYI